MTREECTTKFETMLQLRNLSIRSNADYLRKLNALLDWCSNQDIQIDDLNYHDLQEYVLFLKRIYQYAPKTINSNISVIRFLFLYVLRRPIDRYMLPYARIDKPIQEVLSVEEVRLFIQNFSNIKHKAMVAVLYSCGLRGSELCSLRYCDISRTRKTVYVEHTKNRSSRYVPISDTALNILTEYWFSCGRPKEWLFPGNKPGSHVTMATLRAIILENKEKLGWKDRRITTHTFRHCMGTHLYEATGDLFYIQKFLGHNAISSTTVYITLTGNRSYSNPLDTAWHE